MKAIRTFLLFTIFALLVSVQAFAQTVNTDQNPVKPQEQQAKAPDLPDYVKPPYNLTDSGEITCVFHPEWGILKASLYLDNNDDPLNEILVFLNEDDSLKYAIWVSYNVAASKATKRWFRGYIYKDGKWVFEKEVAQERPAPEN